MTTSNTHVNKDAAGRYAAVNGLEMYYEVYGSGPPLVLVHGGLGTIEMFARILPDLAATRQVIAVELQGHGHTADIPRPLSFEQMADDVAALIGQLGLAPADILGYSLGGGVALQTTIRHPEAIRKLVLASAPCKRAGWYAEDLVGMSSITAELAATWVGSPMHAAYAAAAPRPEDWPALAARVSQLLRQDYDWSEAVKALAAPVLILVGDADGVRLDHAVELFGLLGGATATRVMGPRSASQLAVLPNTTHLEMMEREELLLPMIQSFLDAPMPPGTGSDTDG